MVSLMFSNLKLLSRWFRILLRASIEGVVRVDVCGGVAPVNRGITARKKWGYLARPHHSDNYACVLLCTTPEAAP